ncbi:MAG: acyl-CoA dehydrogenase [Saprospiraceae bacterium]|nr:acyl-CoA dehydrogenase [Bacteroidia bacterium]NNE14756.1 acyl-CoA dehydrogenase [Saprospiraceae bacterium]NNL91719.1 acyl-CoA dehydrogenase [Saprospiraceae bacterium]
MANKYFDAKTLGFYLKYINNLSEVMSKPYYADHDMESMDMFIQSVNDFADKELFPYFQEMDEQPCHFKDGKIVVHPQVEKIMKQGGELGIIAASVPFEEGGLQMPYMVYTAATFILDAANNHLPGYAGLTLGAADLILNFGDEDLKTTYTPNMLAGEWAGTMCLTEPQAGSSLSDITTSAKPNDDGSYNIKGQKIFISGGDHEYLDNFVHLVLARVEGAPVGTKGISLFVVPKNRIEDDNSLISNDVQTAGDFQKLGQRGYCTTHLIFGEKDNCKGWIVGQENKGLKYMFLMMNAARIAVGRGAAGIVSAGYFASLEYANERKQGRKLNDQGKKNSAEEQTLITNHPDVRRMLMHQKTIAEGSLNLILLTSKYADLSKTAEEVEERERYKLLLELLTPITKTYPSEMGLQAISNGVQVLGGYGFCSEYILQQYYRDIRIFSIYEGTTGIQSLDLLGRKVLMQNGAALSHLMNEFNVTLKAAKTQNSLVAYADKLESKIQLAQKVIGHLAGFAQQGAFLKFTADANLFMEFFSHILLGWMWLDTASKACKALESNDSGYSQEFLESKIKLMQFFFKYELSKTSSLAESLMDDKTITLPTGVDAIAD